MFDYHAVVNEFENSVKISEYTCSSSYIDRIIRIIRIWSEVSKICSHSPDPSTLVKRHVKHKRMNDTMKSWCCF